MPGYTFVQSNEKRLLLFGSRLSVAKMIYPLYLLTYRLQLLDHEIVINKVEQSFKNRTV